MESDEGNDRSFFDDVVFSGWEEETVLRKAFEDDSFHKKVDLSFSDYRNDEGGTWVLPVVQSVERKKAMDRSLNYEYLPTMGQFDFRLAGIHLLLGRENVAVIQNKVDAIQSIDSTGSIHLGLQFLSLFLSCTTVYVSRPCWGNIWGIAKSLNYAVREYRYWDREHCRIDIEGMLEDLKDALDFSVIILDLCGHIPTGSDLTLEEWKSVADVLKEKNVFVFFHCTSQGLCSGDLDIDAAPLRMFVKEGFELFVAQSFSKNFGLYDESVGQLAFVVRETEDLFRISSQLSILLITMFGSPPQHGSRVVATVLNSSALSMEWRENVRAMAEQLKAKRQLLYFKLKAIGSRRNWDHIVRQKGLFSFTGLSPMQVEFLRKQYHIYLTRDGRINICGISPTNIDYLTKAIHDAVTKLS